MPWRKPDFRDGDTVMICRHLFERAARGLLSLPWKSVVWEGRFEHRLFYRDDGSEGHCNYFVQCGPCSQMKRTEVDYIEEFWQNGHLHVADFCKRAVS
jgi:hypothetical protein